MFSKSLIVFFGMLAAVDLINALPVGHIRARSACPVRRPSSAASVSVTATSAVVSSSSRPSAAVKTSSATPQATTSSGSQSSSSSGSSVVTSVANTLSALTSALFPSGGSSPSTSWTTSPVFPNAFPLSDSTFNLTHDMSVLSHNYVNAPDGTLGMQANYAKGSYTLEHAPYGGVSFYASGPGDVDLTTAKEATFGYSVFFQEGFQFNKGGKLPGLYGGDSEELAYGCSGGRISPECFSARLMWRTNGMGELYTYLPPSSQYPANKVQCDVKPFSTCNPTYGASVGRGSFTFKTGEWNTVTQRVKLNDPGQSNGELQLFVGGQSVIDVNGLVLRDGDAGRIRGIQMQSFFGGHDASYASPQEQSAWFKDFTTAILDTL